MLPGDRFLPGLASFILAHLAYLVAFTCDVSTGGSAALLLPVLGAAAVTMRLLWPGLGRLKAPVLVYTFVIILMVWQAWARGWTLATGGSTLAAVGAAFFMGSDALLAINRFRAPLRNAQALVMTTYALAQSLIALSSNTA
jgi:uncharacterized membrane protein YhhN